MLTTDKPQQSKLPAGNIKNKLSTAELRQRINIQQKHAFGCSRKTRPAQSASLLERKRLQYVDICLQNAFILQEAWISEFVIQSAGRISDSTPSREFWQVNGFSAVKMSKFKQISLLAQTTLGDLARILLSSFADYNLKIIIHSSLHGLALDYLSWF